MLRRAVNDDPPATVPPNVPDVLRSPDQPLDSATRALREPGHGHDFSQVRVDAVRSPALQTKVTISEPGDADEQEADRVALQVMRMPGPTGTGEPTGQRQIPGPLPQPAFSGSARTLHRHPANETEDEGKEKPPDAVDMDMPKPEDEAKSPPPVTVQRGGTTWLQRRRMEGEMEGTVGSKHVSGQSTAITGVDEQMNGGMPLSASARSFFEPRFGHAFDHVRVHTDRRAAASARAVNALAYTLGPHIVFGEGQYAPDDSRGRRLLAHELTHVLQQNPAQPLARSPGFANAPLGIRSRGIGSPTLQRWSVEAPIAGINTIVCDGSGGITTQRGAPGDADHIRCRGDCLEIHEQSHRADALAENATICGGVVAGKTVRPRAGEQKRATERYASNAELDCLTPKLARADAACRPILEARIKQMKEYRESFTD